MRVQFGALLGLVEVGSQINLVHVDPCHLWWARPSRCIYLCAPLADLRLLTGLWYSAWTRIASDIHMRLGIFGPLVLRVWRQLPSHLIVSEVAWLDLVWQMIVCSRGLLLFYFLRRLLLTDACLIYDIRFHLKTNLAQIRLCFESFHAVLQSCFDLPQSCILLSDWNLSRTQTVASSPQKLLWF